MLASNGHQVQVFERHSDDIRRQRTLGLLRGAVATPWSVVSARGMRRTVAQFRPHVVHAHNTFPLISPSVFPAAKGAARVLTLHNYRLFCSAGIPMRSGKVCTDCLDQHSVWPALRHGCYRNSRIATLPLAAGIALHRARGTWSRDVEAFIALSEFQRERLVAAGLPAERVYVKPNFFPGSPVVAPLTQRVRRVVFVGRLSEEKGAGDLVDAWTAWGADAPELIVVGDGPLLAALQTRCARLRNVRLLGQVDSAQAQGLIAESLLLVLPSRCYEGFPMVLRESFAFGTPSLVSDLGPLPSMVASGAGLTFQAGNTADLLLQLKRAWSDEALLQRMSVAARVAFERLYTEEANYLTLMAIYRQAMTNAGVQGE